ncbi:hypothetical protein G1H11_02810 [Phytoactinopolyspora alkaliphila]|uniref:Uncharacterized protein n=1 Tax=Phytoactinopolyspora alkaliphila TaxID=1783498 RepID=A0A6N9YGZ2_9ACTN|nr:hypothetical protein [Phytoactinopolyspora alkaliphila]NED94234.1 hypothetical protein [Phytoactinopolyspora alkaliphila]
MSTLAIWLFLAVAVLFVLAVLGVLLAVRSTWRKSKIFVREMDSLSQDVERTVGLPQYPNEHVH